MKGKKYKQEWQKKNMHRDQVARQKYRAMLKLEKPWIFSFRKARERCNYAKGHKFHSYGARGITFLLTEAEIEHLWYRDNADMMDMPTIDRIDNDGNYEIDNCQFIEHVKNVQKSNRP